MSDWLARYYRQAPVNSIFILITLSFYALTALQSRSLSHSLHSSSLGDALILWGPAVITEDLGLLRAVGFNFLHLDVGHLAVNLFILLLMGREVEEFFGTLRYLFIVLAGAAGSAAAILWMSPLSPTAGASGVVFALMAVFVAVCIRRRVDLRGPVVLILVNVLYTFIATSVSFWGHAGGLLTGVMMALILLYRSPKFQLVGIIGVFLLQVVLLLVWKLNWSGFPLAMG